MAQYRRPTDRDGFEIAIFCALSIESDPVLALFDERWEDTYSYGKALGDTNTYTTGRVGCHNVVLVFMPGMGKSHAASVAASCRSSFRNIKLGLLVGICGGIPGGTNGHEEILLGDVIVSTGIVQYDFGRQLSHQVVRKNTVHDQLGRPSPEIRGLLNKLMGAMGRDQLRRNITRYLKQLSLQPYDHLSYPGISEDHLFEPAYNHKHHDETSCIVCSQDTNYMGAICDAALELSCSDLKCDTRHLVPRRRVEVAKRSQAPGFSSSATLLDWPQPMVHFGLIASGDLVMKTAHRRDTIAKDENVIAFEMEGAGVWDQFPTVVIKGVCDYADSHKNKRWQKYAASTAAACVKAFLTEWRTHDTSQQPIFQPDGHIRDYLTEATLSRRSTTLMASLQPSESYRPVLSPGSNAIPSTDQRQYYLDSLKFHQIGARQFNIKNALAKTCTWLLDAPEYLHWLDDSMLDEHHGFLWIKGKPAAGKSTIMKFVLQKVEKSMTGSIVISFFFNARGENLEMSTLGMYRSLLFQLLEKAPDLQALLDRLPAMGADASSGSHVWDTINLQNMFESAIDSLGARRLICFIDALDECGEDEIRDMVRFFEHLGRQAVDSSSEHRLLICFSSRHYPYITIGNSIQLVLEDQENHQQDIVKYINSELKVKRSKLTEEIKVDILKRASGIFLWVVLVVQILNRESDKGRLHLRALHQKLREIPDGLDKLFKSVLTKDSENMEELILCIRWVLYARQPLKCEELYHAILIGLDPTTIDEWDPEEINQEEMERFILSSSKGLAEVTKGRNRIVQFIHESVRDFLLRENGLEKLKQNLSHNFQGKSHAILKQCCDSYIKASVGPLPLSSDELESSSEGYPMLAYAVMNILWHADVAHGSGLRQDDFLKHFDLKVWIFGRNYFGRHKRGRAFTSRASPLYVYTCEGLTNFLRDEIQRVRTVDIPGEYYGYLILAAIHRKDRQVLQTLLEPAATHTNLWRTFEEQDVSLTENARENVITSLLRDGAPRPFSKSTTLLAHAAVNGDIDLVKALLNTGKVDINATGRSDTETALFRAVAGDQYEVVKLLADFKGIDVMLESRSGVTGLAKAASSGSIEMIKSLLSIPGCDPNGSSSRSPLQQAALGGHKEVVKLLLADKRVLKQMDDWSSPSQPLRAAALLCNHPNAPDVVRMLLETGRINPDLGNAFGHTLFHEVVQQIRHVDNRKEGHDWLKHKSSYNGRQGASINQLVDQTGEVIDLDDTRLNLQLPADSDGVNQDPCCESRAAEARTMDLGTDQTVIDDTAIIDGHSLSDDIRELASDTARSAMRREIADLLLDSGRVNPNHQSGASRLTALHSAVFTGNQAAIRYLLSIGVDPNLEDIEGRTPFHQAVESGAYELAELLLACDRMNPDTKDVYGMTPMLSAVCNELDHTIEILVRTRHMDVDVVNDNDRPTPIWAAAAGRLEHTVKLLSSMPLGKSTFTLPKEVALYRRVMQHIEGRAIFRAKSGLSRALCLDVTKHNAFFFETMQLEQQSNVRIIRAAVNSASDFRNNLTNWFLPTFATFSVRADIIRRKTGEELNDLKRGRDGEENNLQDYHMQLMLLEQQNKKRSRTARQEQSEKRQMEAMQDEHPSKRQEMAAPNDLMNAHSPE